MKIAVIGGGVAGLACAYHLKDRHEVTLLEKADRLGGHAHTVDVEIDGRTHAIDTGFIVYNERTYPEFVRLLDRLGVAGRPTRMSFSVSCASTGLEYGSDGVGGLFAQKRNLLNLRHYRMLREILRFNRDSRSLLDAPCGLSLRDYLEREDYSDDFTRRYLLPMCAAIWSGSLRDAEAFPVDHFVEFFENHGLLTVTDQPRWYTVEGGSRSYVRRIQAALGGRVRTGTTIRGIRRRPQGVEIRLAGGTEYFDEVVLACHSDEALVLLSDPTGPEREILGALPYQSNDVVLHHDASLLPRRRGAWASWNYRITRDLSRPATVTYYMNRLQGLRAPVQFCVTLNQQERIDSSKVLGTYVYDHPVYTTASSEARRRWSEISGRNRTHYCGAYWHNGFHEDGVRSALNVARALDLAQAA